MTIKQCYDYLLIEQNKLKAPSILLEDFIYLFNKSIQQYINGVYNRCEYNQQSSDDLGSLQTKVIIDANDVAYKEELNDVIWTFKLPNDYLHLLNCVAKFEGYKNKKYCGESIVEEISSPCRRLTADLYPGILNNYYMKPSYKRPYYYIINRNGNQDDSTLPDSNVIPTNYEMDKKIVDGGTYKIENPNDDYRATVYLKERYERASNQSNIYIEIHTGESNYKLKQLYITYIKSPMYVSMTEEDILDPQDNTQVLEFPDYICYEIINICSRLILENASDPRLQTNPIVNQSIAIPGNK
jgi:hypothetical protein